MFLSSATSCCFIQLWQQILFMEPSTLSRGCLKFHGTDIGASGNTSSTTFQTLSKCTTIKYKTFVLELANPAGTIIMKKVRLIHLLTFLNQSQTCYFYLPLRTEAVFSVTHSLITLEISFKGPKSACVFQMNLIPLQKWKFAKVLSSKVECLFRLGMWDRREKSLYLFILTWNLALTALCSTHRLWNRSFSLCCPLCYHPCTTTPSKTIPTV